MIALSPIFYYEEIDDRGHEEVKKYITFCGQPTAEEPR